MPLALVDDRTIKLPIKLGAEPPTFLINRSLWEQSLLNEQLTLAYLFPRLNEDIDKADRLGATVEEGVRPWTGSTSVCRATPKSARELAKAKPSQGAKPLDLSKGDAHTHAFRI